MLLGLKPETVSKGIVVLVLGVFLCLGISRSVFYAEPGYIYHVRTVMGNEDVVSDTGYKFYPLGRVETWKRAMTVQATSKQLSGSTETLSPLGIRFLDNVDARAEATVRFSIPTDRESFLRLAGEYRTPQNLLRTALVPSFEETLQANASLMTAEEYYAGGRNEFNSEFQSQMSKGTYSVKREERIVEVQRTAKASSNASKGKDQEEYGEGTKTIFVINRLLDDKGVPVRNPQQFLSFGITVVSALITDVDPNKEFLSRMKLKQKASADRAIAREQRVQEEEQRLLAIAKGEREVAERQADAKVDQIQKTTEAETSKQLTITHAEKIKEEALIEKETAQIKLERAIIDAKTKRTLAEAEAYQKKVILEADNALAQKLEAEVQIQKVWADAFSIRKVPTTVFGSSDSPNSGADSEVKMFMQMMTVEAAKRLNYNRQVEGK